MKDKNGIQKGQKFYCEKCNFTTSRFYHFERHLSTWKHKNGIKNGIFSKTTNIDDLNKNECECGKKYRFVSGLYRHKKKCTKGAKGAEKIMDGCKEKMVLELIKQNQELILENKDFKDKLYELASKPTTVVHNTKHIQNNKQFNLNIFLNETCKHAMNMSDFIHSLVICNEDFENMGKLGYVQGISNILIRGLKGLNQTERPCHCTDKKRETMYIKQNNVWSKEQALEIMKQVILDVSFKNVKKIPFWKAEHPHCEDTSTQKYLEYIAILNQVMTGIHPDKQSDIDKIMRNVSHSVVLDKLPIF